MKGLNVRSALQSRSTRLLLMIIIVLVAFLIGYKAYRSAAPQSLVWKTVTVLEPGHILTKDDLASELVPPSAVPADAVLDPQEVEGKRLLYGVPAGEPLRHSHVADQVSPLATQLAAQGPGTAALSLPGDLVGGLLGQLQPGDLVALFGVTPLRNQTTNTDRAQRLAVALVMHVDLPAKSGSVIGSDNKGSVLLSLTQEEAQAVALALRVGSVNLVVLPSNVSRTTAPKPITTDTLGGDLGVSAPSTPATPIPNPTAGKGAK